MRADLRLALRSRRFDPAGLFADGAAGALYEPRPGAVFQDADGTIPAGIGDPVGRLADLSGNGNHAVQSFAAARPVLARAVVGYPYLAFDGADDALHCVFACPEFDRVTALRLESGAPDHQILGGGNANLGVLVQRGTSPGISMYGGQHVGAAGPAIGSDGVVAERHRGAASELRVNGAPAVAGDTGGGLPGGITIGAYLGGTYSYASQIRFYGLVMIGRLLSAAEMAAARRWAGLRAGLSL